MKSDMPEVPANRGDDIHFIEYMEDADLILFMAGNQFMVMDELICAFREEYPEIQKIFYETLPPGLELKQILEGGAIFKDKVLTGTPDVYTSVSEEGMLTLVDRGKVIDYSVYLHNRLVFMVARGNPLGIEGIDDLQRDGVRISHPGSMEDITSYIIDMYLTAGGEPLAHRIMEEKRAEATTIYTVVHHRETPLRILKGTADVGPVWATEVIEARRKGPGLEAVEVGPELDQRDHVNYYIARLTDAPNPQNGDRFIEFIKTRQAQEIYQSYGFVPL